MHATMRQILKSQSAEMLPASVVKDTSLSKTSRRCTGRGAWRLSRVGRSACWLFWSVRCRTRRRRGRPAPAARRIGDAVSRPRVKMHQSRKKMREWCGYSGGGDERDSDVQGEIVGTGGPRRGDACCDGPGEAVEIWGDPGGGGGGVDDASIVTSGVSRKSAAS